jgi:chemotaxis family two-component system response regulator PixH
VTPITPPLVLIVDDMEDMQHVLATLCRGQGYEVALATNAEDGIQKALLMRPSVILLDVMLPGIKGTEALAHLKRHPSTSRIPVVVVTGYPYEGTEEWCSMAADILRKPFSLERVRSMLASVIDGSTRACAE